MKVFARKATALKYLKEDMIICNDDIKKYFILKNWNEFKGLIENKKDPNYYEFVNEKKMFNLFMDIEIYKEKNPIEYNNDINIINDICDKIKNTMMFLYNFKTKFIILALLDHKLSLEVFSIFNFRKNFFGRITIRFK